MDFLKYMKRPALMFAFVSALFISKNTCCQIYDSAHIRAMYSFLYRPDSNSLINVKEDVLVLEIGHKFSNFYSYYNQMSDSIISAAYNKQGGENTTSLSLTTKNVPIGSTKVILRNNVTNVYTITHELVLNSYKYVDSIKNINWAIKTDTATISGYKCIKAVAPFRGRIYEAWFARDIPVSSGPHLFSGLPGLIVRIKDIKENFEYKLLSLELLHEKKPIAFDRKKTISVTRQVYRRLVQNMINDMDGFAASQGMIFKTKSIDGVSNPPPPPKPPYNPIELE